MIFAVIAFFITTIVNFWILIAQVRKLNGNIETVNESLDSIDQALNYIIEVQKSALQEMTQFTKRSKNIEAILSNIEHNNDLLLYSKLQDVKLRKE